MTCKDCVTYAICRSSLLHAMSTKHKTEYDILDAFYETVRKKCNKITVNCFGSGFGPGESQRLVLKSIKENLLEGVNLTFFERIK